MLNTVNELAAKRAQRRQTANIQEGTRFFRAGHWWQVDDYITGREGRHYRCHPVCNIETRFFTDQEISQALHQQTQQVKAKGLDQCPDDPTHLLDCGRGSGRINNVLTFKTQPSRLSKDVHLASVKTCKLLAIGSQNSVRQTILYFHSLGVAHVTDWSPLQRRPKSQDFISILTGVKSQVKR